MMASSPGNIWSHDRNSASPCPSSSVPEPSSNRKSTEEVWKDMKFASLCNCSMDLDTPPSSSTNNTPSSFRNTILHEFLAGPFNKDSSAIIPSARNPILVADSAFPNQVQPTLLSFSSRSVFQKQSQDTDFSSFNTSFDASESSTISPSYSKERVRRDIYDKRYNRMIKNRESAIRSKARKKAYKNALEIKLARLTEENSRLIKQVEELQLCLSSSAKPPRGNLYRTSTCPF